MSSRGRQPGANLYLREAVGATVVFISIFDKQTPQLFGVSVPHITSLPLQARAFKHSVPAL